jgi:peroxiredoxin
MKNYSSILLTCILLIPLFCRANPDSLLLRGSFADTTGKNGEIIECKILAQNTPLDRQIIFTQTFQTKTISGKFALSLPIKSDWLEVTFSRINKEGKTIMVNSGNNMEAVYTFYKDDRPIMLLREGNDITFAGEGSARLNCQAKLYELGYLPQPALERFNELSNNGDYLQAYRTYLIFLRQQLTFKHAILETYRDSLPKEVFSQIWDDQKGIAYGAFYYGLYLSTGRYGSKATTDIKAFLKEIENEHSSPDSSQAAILSPYYTNSLLLKEIVNVRNEPEGDTTNRLDFGQLYDSICSHYHGTLKDRLIFLAFLEFSTIKGEPFIYLEEAIAGMGDNESRRLLLEWKGQILAGNSAFPFELPDESGHMVKLKDFRGKVIVCDFWFTGCENCIGIPPAMAAVCKKYSGNSKVVFLSINVDKQKKWWDFGLKQGIYSIPGSIHLSTFGEGMSHPFLRYYNYTAFPQLLIIDKDGNTKSAFPTDPRIDHGKAIIEIVDELSN